MVQGEAAEDHFLEGSRLGITVSEAFDPVDEGVAEPTFAVIEKGKLAKEIAGFARASYSGKS